MRVFSVLRSLLGAVSAAALPHFIRGDPTGATCGTTIPDGFGEMSRGLATMELAGDFTVNDFANVTVNVYFHVVAAVEESLDPAAGYISVARIQKAFRYINDRFRPHGFEFVVREIDYTYGVEFSDHTDPNFDFEVLGLHTRNGDLLDLNIWTATKLEGAAGGYCIFPLEGMTLGAGEGCVLKYDDFPPFNRGEATVHELGHWLGLGHTFQEGVNGAAPSCDDPDGDWVADTPIHLIHPADKDDEFFNCLPINTCPNKEGSDPISNPMNYIWPKCQSGFTQGQGVRMHNTWENVRKVANRNLRQTR
ncbi:hypothetical protein PMIN07_007890 [Paraphaeosphaeria minitans]|uniref:Metalloprotease n=1 Tax=Paraphaeosphaeria minitans TaxID=565426 RepID=A0A9P6GCC5_9PLEO|nr:metalloprotease [Paraphaeosphaeria minitans]